MRLLPFLAALVAAPLCALDLSGLSADNHIAGPAVSPESLDGKVVAIYDFGRFCPRCKAAFPKVAKLADDLTKETRVVFLGSHLQGRDDAAIRAVLESAGCPNLPTYQFLGVPGAPSAGSLLPTGYVVGHDGEVVWAGNTLEDFAAFEKAVKDAIKAAPKPVPGSIADGMTLRYNQDFARRLMIGQNIEAALRQLQSRARRSGPAGEEARALLTRCQDWAKETEAAIRANIETNPSQALADGQTLLRTLPSKAADLKPLLDPLIKDPRIKALATSRLALANLRKTAAQNPSRVKSSATLQLRRLSSIATPDDPDLQALRTEWQTFIDSLP